MPVLGTVTDGAFQSQSGENFKIEEIKLTQAPALAAAVIIRKGEDFELKVTFSYTEILGDLHAKIKFNMYAHNIATGGIESTYNVIHEENLATDATGHFVKFPITNAQAEGVFKYVSVAIVPDSAIAAFIEGPVFSVIP